jgi:hypothetical protein
VKGRTTVLDKLLPGMLCTEVIKQDYAWSFIFDEGKASFNLWCPWRLLLKGSIAHGYEDDGQLFGLPEPVNGVQKATELIGSSPIVSVDVRPGPSDLTINFQNGVSLEIFNMSSGYEAWICDIKNGPTIVAQGGGDGTFS